MAICETELIEQTSVMPSMLALASRADVLSLALGLPDPDLFPVADWMRAAVRLTGGGPGAFQYGIPERHLKTHICRLMARRGVTCHEDQVLVTAGAQQGLCLLATLLLREERLAAVEEFTYPNFTEILRQQRARVMTVPTSAETGLDVEALEQLLVENRRPALLYVMPDGHNPLGVNMSVDARIRLVRLARHHRLPIIEDDTYGLLAYDTPTPPLRAYDDEWVCYVGSLSKILAPAMRIGWIVMPDRFAAALAILKEASDINTGTFDQRVTAAYLETGAFPDQLERVREEYRRRRDAILEAVRRLLPAGTRCTTPGSGFFAWLELPPGIDTTGLFRTAVETQKVAFIPGEACRAVGDGLGRSCLRLNFSRHPPETIRDGVGRLALAIDTHR